MVEGGAKQMRFLLDTKPWMESTSRIGNINCRRDRLTNETVPYCDVLLTSDARLKHQSKASVGVVGVVLAAN